MATISNSARISGLSSGLDVESIVEGLTLGTQGKIHSAEQDLQVLEWKQESYQEVTDSLYEFMNAYCGTSNFSMLAVSDLAKLSATCSSSAYVTVSTTNNSVNSSIYISDIVSLATAGKVKSSSSVSAPLSMTVDTASLYDLPGKSMKVTLDGVTKTLTFSDGVYSTASDAAAELQSLLDGAFGSGRISVSQDGDTISMSAENSKITLGDSGANDASGILGFESGDCNRLILTDTVAQSNLAAPTGDTIEFSINGVGFSFTSSDTIQSIIRTVNSSDAGVTMAYSSTTDTFTLSSEATGSASDVAFEDTTGSFLSAILGAGVKTDGTDAVITVGFDGDTENLVTLVRNSNTFEIDGTSYTLTGKAPGDSEEGITVSIGLNASAAAEKITRFFEAYNDLISTISDKLYEKNYSYKPLSSAEKADMTDREIEEWTDKAKSGLLNNDTYLKTIYNDMRNAMLNVVNGLDGNSLGLSLSSIGISTNSYTDRGQLKIDKDALLSALSSDPDAVMALLTQSSSVRYSNYLTSESASKRYGESGLMWRVGDIVKNNLSRVGNKGSLVTLVGSPSNSYSGTTKYGNKIEDKKDTIEKLLDKLDKEEDRYWAKFTALEKAMSQLNSMSGYLSTILSV